MQLWADSEPSKPHSHRYSKFLPKFLQLPFIAPHCPNIPLARELLQVFFRTYSSSGGTESKWKLTANLRFVNYISKKLHTYIQLFIIPLLIVVSYTHN